MEPKSDFQILLALLERSQESKPYKTPDFPLNPDDYPLYGLQYLKCES